MDAIDKGDRSLADKLLEKIERDGMESAANAAYLRGNIAAAEIRWADAAILYAKSATLDPTYRTPLRRPQNSIDRAGDLHRRPCALGDPLIAAAIKFGELLLP